MDGKGKVNWGGLGVVSVQLLTSSLNEKFKEDGVPGFSVGFLTRFESFLLEVMYMLYNLSLVSSPFVGASSHNYTDY